MNIVAVLRLVPDLTGDIEILPHGKSMDREWIDMKLNEFDDHAMEEAILLKESVGGKVTAIALAGEGVDRLLQTALARGADAVQKLSCDLPDGASSRQASALFAEAIRKLGADVVLTGVQTSDDIFGQLAPCLGARLGWPHVSAVSGLSAKPGVLTLQQEFSGGRSTTVEVELPAVVGVQTASQPIRYVSGSKLRQVSGSKIDTIDLAMEPASNLAEIVSLAPPVKKGSTQMLQGNAQSVAHQIKEILAQRGMLRR